MRKARNPIPLLWPNLIWWCRYLILLHRYEFICNIIMILFGEYWLLHLVVLLSVLQYIWHGLDDESWYSWFRILLERRDLPSIRWIQVTFLGILSSQCSLTAKFTNKFGLLFVKRNIIKNTYIWLVEFLLTDL